MNSELKKRATSELLIKGFHERGANFNALIWLIKEAIRSARTKSRQLTKLRRSFFIHYSILTLILIATAGLLHHVLENGLSIITWIVEILSIILVGIISYFMLGFVRAEDNNQPYDFFPIPNTITLFRLLMIPILINTIVAPLSIEKNSMLVFILLVVAAISDTLDGNIARLFHLKSDFGRMFDPAVDVLFHTGLATALFIKDIIPWWFLIIVLLRYLLPVIAGPFIYLFKKRIRVKSTIPGKISTFFLSCFLGFYFLGKAFKIKRLVDFAEGPWLWLSGIVTALTFLYFLVGGVVVVKKGDAIDKN